MKRVLEFVVGLLLFLMFLTTFYQVFARAVLQISSVWSEELARFTYVLMVFVGAAVLIRDDGLIRVTVLTDRIGKRAAALLRILTDLAIVPFLGVFTWGAWMNTRLNWNTIAPTIDWLRIGYIYLTICLSGVLMLGYLLANLARRARASLGKPGRDPEATG